MSWLLFGQRKMNVGRWHRLGMNTSPRTKGSEGQPGLSLPLLVYQALTKCLAYVISFNLLVAHESVTAKEM